MANFGALRERTIKRFQAKESYAMIEGLEERSAKIQARCAEIKFFGPRSRTDTADTEKSATQYT